jgi:fibronectin-binding autotransporter adhesin
LPLFFLQILRTPTRSTKKSLNERACSFLFYSRTIMKASLRRPFHFGNSGKPWFLLFVLAGALALPQFAVGQTTYVWNNGASTGNWDTTDANWSGSVWANSLTNSIASFTGSPAGTVTLTAAISADAVNFSGSGAYTITGNTLTLGAGGITDASTAAQAINSAVVLNNAQTWTNSGGALLTVGGTINNNGNTLTTAGSGNITLSNIISGAGGLNVTGTGTVTLTDLASTYAGGTTVAAGSSLTINAAAGAGTGAIRGAITVNAGATLTLASANALGYFNSAIAVSAININGGTVITTTANDQGF